jgi:hypothetical protein
MLIAEFRVWAKEALVEQRGPVTERDEAKVQNILDQMELAFRDGLKLFEMDRPEWSILVLADPEIKLTRYVSGCKYLLGAFRSCSIVSAILSSHYARLPAKVHVNSSSNTANGLLRLASRRSSLVEAFQHAIIFNTISNEN